MVTVGAEESSVTFAWSGNSKFPGMRPGGSVEKKRSRDGTDTKWSSDVNTAGWFSDRERLPWAGNMLWLSVHTTDGAVEDKTAAAEFGDMAEPCPTGSPVNTRLPCGT